MITWHVTNTDCTCLSHKGVPALLGAVPRQHMLRIEYVPVDTAPIGASMKIGCSAVDIACAGCPLVALRPQNAAISCARSVLMFYSCIKTGRAAFAQF